MMYHVRVKQNGEEYPLYEPLDEEMRIFEPVLTEEMGSAGSFSFRIHKGHPNFIHLQPFQSEIIVYEDTEPCFYGRMLKPETDFQNMVSIVCEGELTYLLDSIQRPFSYSGTIEGYIETLLDTHNSQVEAQKQIQKGTIRVTGPSISQELKSYTDTLTGLRKLAEESGGYFRIRHSGEKRYLDYLWDYGGENLQPIRFGENLLDLTKYVDPSGIITCLIVQGGEVEYQDELGETQTRTVDISSINSGKDYLEATEAIARYGRIWGYQKFEDVTVPADLLEKGKAYLSEASALPETIELKAVDLSLIDTSVSAFRLGYWTQVESIPHDIQQKFLLSRREVNLLDASQGSITLGRQAATLTGNMNKSQSEVSDRVEQTAKETSEEINRKIENATNLITGGLGGYVILDNIDPETGKKMHPWRILIMNTPDKATAKNVIQINQNGIGFSTTGINGPYRNAWTIDGNLVADFITTGTMLAERIRGGTLEVGGTGLGKDGVIVIRDSKGTIIGQLDKSGIRINNGYFSGHIEVGGTGTGKDGSILIRDSKGAIIGQLDKNGIRISSGNFSGQVDVGGNTDGKITVKNAAGAVIGYWDKTGLHVEQGTISGTDITGGTINIGKGTFVVNEDGSVSIMSGEIDIANLFYAGEDHVTLGDFEISNDGTNVFQSIDGSVVLQSGNSGPLGDFPILVMQESIGSKMELSSHHLDVTAVYTNVLLLSGTSEWNDPPYNGNVGMILDYIWNNDSYGLAYLGHEVRSLQSQVDDLYDQISSLG